MRKVLLTVSVFFFSLLPLTAFGQDDTEADCHEGVKVTPEEEVCNCQILAVIDEGQDLDILRLQGRIRELEEFQAALGEVSLSLQDGYSSLEEKYLVLKDNLGEFLTEEEIVVLLTAQREEVEARIVGLETFLSDLLYGYITRLSKLEERVEEIEEDVVDIKDDVDNIETELARRQIEVTPGVFMILSTEAAYYGAKFGLRIPLGEGYWALNLDAGVGGAGGYEDAPEQGIGWYGGLSVVGILYADADLANVVSMGPFALFAAGDGPAPGVATFTALAGPSFEAQVEWLLITLQPGIGVGIPIDGVDAQFAGGGSFSVGARF